MSSTPRWDSLGSAGNYRSTSTAWDLRWWIVWAVLTSIVVNGGVILAMPYFLTVPPAPAAAPADQQTGVFEFNTEPPLSLPDTLLQEIVPEPPMLEDRPQNEPPATTPDVSDLAEALKSRDMILTPTIESVAANVTTSTPMPGAQGDPIDALGDTRMSLDTSFAKSLLNTSSNQPASNNRDDDLLKIDASSLDQASASLKGDVMKALKKGTGGGGGIDGFANLDDLVNYQGPIVGDFKAMLKTDLLFDFGSAVLREDARISLIKLGAIIQSNTDAMFRLIGHTDTIGDEASNQILSEARAMAVKTWLVEKLRVDGANIIAEGMGEREPLKGVNTAGTAEQQALNRRVEIHKTSKR